MKRSKSIFFTTLLLLLLGMLTACGSKKEASNEIHIGFFNNVTHAQALLMKSTGTLEEACGDDVTVTWTAFNAGPAEQEALFSGDIDIGYIGPVPAITANVKSGGDIQILTGATRGGAILVKGKDSDIESVSDLSGKDIAIPQIGNTQHLCLLHLLAENDLKPETEGGDVTIHAIANADVANTMERGDIDGALVPEPWGATLLEQGSKMVLDYDQIYLEGQYDVAVVVVRKEFMEEHPELVEKFLQAHEEATRELNENQASALAVINKELDASTGKSLSESIIEDAFTRIDINTELNRDSILGFAEISKEQGFIDSVPEETQLYSDK